MNTLTYKKAFDLITEAYIKGEIEPFNADFCFCGTLCSGSKWHRHSNPDKSKSYHNNYLGYTSSQFVEMERALLDSLKGIDISSPPWEDAIFNGMSAALYVLKQIHIERGEIIDETPVFTKRQLA